MNQNALIREGRSWVFAEANINTDLIMPSAAFTLPLEKQLRLVFSANRPDWVDQVGPGDVLVGGRNFGTGSSRPCAQLLRGLGISALVAESINGLFYRNCVNYALPAMECQGIVDAVSEGDTLRVDVAAGKIENLSTGSRLEGRAMPEFLCAIVREGGVMARLRKDGYVE